MTPCVRSPAADPGDAAAADVRPARPARRALSRFGVTALLATTLSAAALVTATPAAAAWPERPIRLVVPFPPGGSTDLLARRIGERLATALGQPVVVENRAGAGGTVGADHVAKAAPDGYTLLMGVTGSNAIAQSLYPNLPYDVLKDFAPVSIVISAPLVLAVHPAVKAGTAAEFLALAKAQPGSISYGSPGNGTSMHLTGEMVRQATGVSMVHVPYRGSAAMLTDLAGGQIQATFGDVLVLKPQIDAGKIRALAVTSKSRHPTLADVPTLQEAGLADFEALSWQGVFAPAGTPDAIVTRLGEEIGKAVAAPEIKDYFGSRGFFIDGMSPSASGRYVAAETAKWARIVKASGAKAE